MSCEYRSEEEGVVREWEWKGRGNVEGNGVLRAECGIIREEW